MVHAQGQNEFWLIDLGSANGTYLNSRRVSQPCRLADKDQIKVGDYAFVFRFIKPLQTEEADATGGGKTIQEIKALHCWLLVADIESSTQITKRVPAEEAPRITGRWLAECKQIVDDHGGTINKFLGDGFFAYWLDQANVEASIVRALTALKQLQARPDPRFRVVVHYGRVFVGGAASMGEESLMGNEVNFVFRIEKMAASIGVSALLSEPAHVRIKSLLPTNEEGRHAVPSFEGEFLFYSF